MKRKVNMTTIGSKTILGDWKLSQFVAVWLNFLLVSTMGIEQQLSINNKQEEMLPNNSKNIQHTTVQPWNEQPTSPSIEDSPQLELYGAWSPWTTCRPHSCTQVRSKHCQPRAHCAKVVLKEERPCRFLSNPKHCNKDGRGQRKEQQRKRKPQFHVVHYHKSVEKIKAGRGDLLGRGDTGNQADLGHELSLQGEYKNAYSRWSRWTPCTRSCTTQRYRLVKIIETRFYVEGCIQSVTNPCQVSYQYGTTLQAYSETCSIIIHVTFLILKCKKSVVCGKNVIRETAFCYQEGSRCQNIHKNMTGRGTDDTSVYSDQQGASGQGYNTAPVTVNPLVPQGDGNLTRRKVGKNMLRIIGGRDADRNRWPWIVAVLSPYKEAFCGGTLIADQWVLTAAHCVKNGIFVRLWEYDLAQREEYELEMKVTYAVIHPYFNKVNMNNDVALLQLPYPVTSTRYHSFVYLPYAHQSLPVGRLCSIIGWGNHRHDSDSGSNVLQEAQVPILSNGECHRVFRSLHITNNMFCAGYLEGGVDTCIGDSGGPLLCQDVSGGWTVFGVTSFGQGCGKRGKYGIYTKVTNFVNWIYNVIRTYPTV